MEVILWHEEKKGTGTIYQRENGKWVGVIRDVSTDNGKVKTKCFSGKTEAEVKVKSTGIISKSLYMVRSLPSGKCHSKSP